MPYKALLVWYPCAAAHSIRMGGSRSFRAPNRFASPIPWLRSQFLIWNFLYGKWSRGESHVMIQGPILVLGAAEPSDHAKSKPPATAEPSDHVKSRPPRTAEPSDHVKSGPPRMAEPSDRSESGLPRTSEPSDHAKSGPGRTVRSCEK